MDKKLEGFLQRIAQIESSGGKNEEHKTLTSGMHKGHSAIGMYGLMPHTIDELAKSSDLPEARALLGKSQEEKKAFLQQNRNIERALAEQLARKVLERQQGDEEKAAYSWLHGHNLTPDKIEKRKWQDEDYVQKYRKLAGVPEQRKELTIPTNLEELAVEAAKNIPAPTQDTLDLNQKQKESLIDQIKKMNRPIFEEAVPLKLKQIEVAAPPSAAHFGAINELIKKNKR